MVKARILSQLTMNRIDTNVTTKMFDIETCTEKGFCHTYCPHPDKPCNGTCKEFREFKEKLKEEKK